VHKQPSIRMADLPAGGDRGSGSNEHDDDSAVAAAAASVSGADAYVKNSKVYLEAPSGMEIMFVVKRKRDGKKLTWREINLGPYYESSEDETAESLKDRLHTLQGVSHPCLVRLQDVFETANDRLVVIEDRIRSQTLRDVVDRAQPRVMLPKTVLKIVHQVVAGIFYLHSARVPALQIRADLIFVSREGKVVVGGLVHVPTPLSWARATATNGVCRLAPEDLEEMSCNKFDRDMWHLGCLVAELATGKHPLSSADTLNQLFANLTRPCPAFAELLNRLVSDGTVDLPLSPDYTVIERLVDGLVVTDPDRRMVIQEVSDLLDDWVAERKATRVLEAI